MMDLLQGVSIYTSSILLNSAIKFESDYVLYGLVGSRHPISNIIEKMNAFNAKIIIIQNTLTNAVWNRRYNILDGNLSVFTDQACWIVTSKAGPEFQTKVRGSKFQATNKSRKV
jgi:Gifsy-1 prophage leucine-rich repeat protein